MRSIFAKLFLSFILIALLVSFTTATIFYFAQISPYNALKKRIRDHQISSLAQSLSITALAAITILENGNENELMNYLYEVGEQEIEQIFLLDENSRSFSGRKLPAGADDLIAASRRLHTTQHHITETEIMVALPLPGKDGKALTILGTTARILRPSVFEWGGKKTRHQGRTFLRHPVRIPIIIMTFIAALGCYLLARSLTAPIRSLRKATRQIASGDFSARVDQSNRQGDEIDALGRDFNIMAEKTQSLLQSQKQLLRDISHELRSPLTRQNMAVELARQHCGEAEPYLVRIEKESDRLNELIGQLLMLTRLENDVDAAPKEPVNLQDLVTDIARDANFEASCSDRRIEIQHLDDVTILGSREMLGRAIENVIRNGLKYTTTGHSVEINVLKKEDQAIIIIRDHGTGVPDKYLGQIFKPFFRVGESRNRESGGSGVGLAIARQAILMHGGNIKAENVENGGLRVEMNLPLA